MRPASHRRTSGSPSRSIRSVGSRAPALGDLPCAAAVRSGIGASLRARASAVARSQRSAATAGSSSTSRRALRCPSSTGRRRRSSTVTPRVAPGGTTLSSGGSTPPSTTRSRWGDGSARSPASSAARSATSPATIRRGPTASERQPECAWGSHFTQSHQGRRSGAASTATARSAGAWNVAAAHTMARATDRVPSSAPQISTRSWARRSTVAGSSDTTRCTASSRCSADAAAGSTRSTGGESATTRSSRSGWSRTP